jgi:hypothetical protein
MVPMVFTLGVVIYTNGERVRFPAAEARAAIIAALPAGTGVGSLTATEHGVYSPAEALQK